MTNKFRSYRGKTASEQWRHQARADAWPSWIDVCCQYILLVIITITKGWPGGGW